MQVIMRPIEVRPEHLEQARKEFPADEMMAELHAVRIAMYEATKHLSVREAMAQYTADSRSKATQ